ncbi:MAG: hypothetical protein JSR21_09485, partial [Proteobacteria bacterium]|nr:hypothetical protein [Pseudomonadota bacterium]
MTRRLRMLLCATALVAAFARCGAADLAPSASIPLSVAPVLDETGRQPDPAELARLRDMLRDALAAYGYSASIAAAGPGMEVRPRLIACRMPPAEAVPDLCIASVALALLPSRRPVTEAVVRAPAQASDAELASAMAAAVERSLVAAPPPSPGAREEDITATGAAVRHLGGGRFLIGGETIDVHAIRSAHDPTVDPDVPAATNVTLNDIVPPAAGGARSHAVITLYQVDPPLTGQPSREAGIDRGTDFRDPANLVQAAYSNYVSPVQTDGPVPVRVAGHPIGHFMVKVEVPGYPTVMTGMTTIARADKELVDLTLGRGLGVGGVLLTPEPGRLNSAAEVVRELALRQRALRVVDGLYFHRVNGRNVGPEYRFADGRVVFLRVTLPVRNAEDALAYFVEYIHRGEA